jgi:hypothetical protein
MRDNLIVACSDDGIYINRSPDSVVLHNTLIDTAGIDVRYPESMATITANLVDGPVRARDGGLVWQDDNVGTGIWQLFLGEHPVRSEFVDPVRLDLRWRGAPATILDGGSEMDLCRAQRLSGAASRLGAFNDFAACLRGGASSG